MICVGVNNFQNVLETFRLAKRDLGEILSACEYSDRETFNCVIENLSLKPPIEEPFPFYLMIETSGSNGKHDEEKLTMFLEKAMEKGFVADGTIASQPSHIKVHIIPIQKKKTMTAGKKIFMELFYEQLLSWFVFISPCGQFAKDFQTLSRKTGTWLFTTFPFPSRILMTWWRKPGCIWDPWLSASLDLDI